MLTKPKPPTVTAVVVHYSASWGSILDLADSVLSQVGSFKTSVVIVRNGQMDAPHAGGDLGDSISVVSTGVNLGYAGGLELARRMFPADYFWVLQDDVVPDQGCLESLHNAFLDGGEQTPLAVASPVEEEPDSSDPRLRFGVFDSVSGERLGMDTVDCKEWLPRFKSPNHNLFGFVYLSGALILGQALEDIGGFDPGYWPLMLVDADNCFSLQRKGYYVARVDSARILHPRRTGREDSRPGWKPLAYSLNLRRLQSKHFPTDAEESINDRVVLPPDLSAAVLDSMSTFLETYTDELLALDRARRRRPRAVRVLRRVKREQGKALNPGKDR